MKLPSLPVIKTLIPGPHSKKMASDLRRYECPQITYIDKDFPVFWESADLCSIQDVDGNIYLDLTAAFGVANCGHNNPVINRAAKKQMDKLTHGMGDVHPTPLKIDLARELARITPGNLSLSIFSSSGSEAVDTALKTAFIATGKPGIISFEGAYHGLTLGALNATAWDLFRKPFAPLLPSIHHILPFPDCSPVGRQGSEDQQCERILAKTRQTVKKQAKTSQPLGSIMIEPVQGRGGSRIPVKGFLKGLRDIADEYGLLLIFDEVYTGFGRTGNWFACEEEKVIPDLLCIGKGMSNGFPISACIGRKKVMDQWGPSQGEAIHTSTFLGHPVGCAMGLATIKEMEEKNIPAQSRENGSYFLNQLNDTLRKYDFVGNIRGRGMMMGLELIKPGSLNVPATETAIQIVKKSLKKGLILLASGEYSNILCLTPPLVITRKQIDFSVTVLNEIFTEIRKSGIQ